MAQQFFMVAAAVFGALAVVAGAFGSHALAGYLSETGRTATYEIAVRYHFYHALALLVAGLLMFHVHGRWIQASAWLFIAGVILFSGSLYVLCLTRQTFWAYITPFGGVLFIIGWFCLAAALIYHE